MNQLSKEKLLDLRKNFLYPTQVPYYTEPLCLVRAKGSRVWDETGREYLDAIGGIVSISVGHNHPRIVTKAKEMLASDAIQHTTYLYLSGHLEELAQKLVSVAPKGLTKCYFTNSGSESVDTALKIALAYHKAKLPVNWVISDQQYQRLKLAVGKYPAKN